MQVEAMSMFGNLIELLIELLKSGNWFAWAGLIVVTPLLLFFCVKLIIRLGKLVFILLLVGVLLYGLAQLFPEQAAPVIEKLQTLWSFSAELPLSED